MSISSISQSIWGNATSALGSSLASGLTDSINFSPAATSANSGSATTGTSSPTGTTGTGTDPFQQLATELQAALVQLQSGGAGTTATSASGTPSTGTTSTPAASATTTDPNSANATQTGSVHHHHHHHGGGGFGQQSADASGNGSSSTLQSDMTKLQSDLSQALQSYGSSSSFAPTPALGVSA